MSYRTVVSISAAAMIGIACVSTEALAYRAVSASASITAVPIAAATGARRWFGVGVGLGAAAVGAAIVAPRYYNSVGCGYQPTDPAIDLAKGRPDRP